MIEFNYTYTRFDSFLATTDFFHLQETHTPRGPRLSSYLVALTIHTPVWQHVFSDLELSFVIRHNHDIVRSVPAPIIIKYISFEAAWGGGCLPQCMLGYTPPPPPVNRMTDRCKNITVITKEQIAAMKSHLAHQIYVTSIACVHLRQKCFRNNVEFFLRKIHVFSRVIHWVDG